MKRMVTTYVILALMCAAGGCATTQEPTAEDLVERMEHAINLRIAQQQGEIASRSHLRTDSAVVATIRKANEMMPERRPLDVPKVMAESMSEQQAELRTITPETPPAVAMETYERATDFYLNAADYYRKNMEAWRRYALTYEMLFGEMTQALEPRHRNTNPITQPTEDADALPTPRRSSSQ